MTMEVVGKRHWGFSLKMVALLFFLFFFFNFILLRMFHIMVFQLVYCDVGFIVADWVFVGILQPCNRRKHKTGFLKIHGGRYYVKVIIFPDWTCLPLSRMLCWELLLSHVCPCIVRINFAKREVFISQVLSFSPFLSEDRFFFFSPLPKYCSLHLLLRSCMELPFQEGNEYELY